MGKKVYFPDEDERRERRLMKDPEWSAERKYVATHEALKRAMRTLTYHLENNADDYYLILEANVIQSLVNKYINDRDAFNKIQSRQS